MSLKEEIGCDHFKSVVKLSYYNEGSGIIFLPETESLYAYILTAKHNFKDKNKKLIPVEDIDNKKVTVEFKEYNEDSFTNISVKEVIYLDDIDLAIIIVENSSLTNDILKMIPKLDILDNEFSHCVFKGYPKISNNEIECIKSKYHAKANRKLFTIKTDEDLSSFDFSEYENTIGFSGSGLLTAFNKKPVLAGILVEVNNNFNGIACIDLKVVKKDINEKLNEKGYKEIEVIESEKVELNKSKEIEIVENHKTNLTTDNNITEQHKNIIEKLESYDINGAKKLLENISEPSGETYRLNALVALTDKDIDLAFDYIESAKNREVVPNDLEFVKGIIYYFSSIDKKGYEKISSNPIDRLYIKTDKKSKEHIKEAQEIFKKLSEKNENLDYDIWYLASLHLIDLAKVSEKVAEFIKINPLHYGSITYITAFNFDIDLNPSIIKLEEIENKSINNIIDLVNCYNHQKTYDKTIVLLTDNNDKFNDNSELLEKCYINTYMLDKKFDEALEIITKSNNKLIKKLESNIIIEKYYSTSRWDDLIVFFEKDLTNESLYNICKVKAIQNDWEFISEHAMELLDEMPFFNVLDLVVTAKYNSKDYKGVLDILESYNKIYSDLNEKFKRIKSNCLLNVGSLQESILLLESLQNKTPEDIFTLIDISKKVGDSVKVEKLVSDFYIDNKTKLNVREKLQLGNMLKDDSPTFASKIYESALSEEITDEEKASLLPEALGMPNNKLFNEIIKTPYAISVDLGDKFRNAIDQDQRNIYQNYLNGNISFHKLDNQRYLTESFNSKNEKIFFSRAGNKIDFINIDSKIKNIYCDISSLLLIDSLDLFERIFSKFETLYIPMNTIEYINENAIDTTLKKELNYYIEQNRIFLTDELSEDDLNEEPLVYILEKSLKYISKTDLQANSILLFDDRAINRYFKTDKADIFTLNDVMYTLFQCSILSKDIYYQKLLSLREKNLMYIPFDKDELIYYLQKAKIKNYRLIETEELSILRKHFAYTIQNLKYLRIAEQEDMSEAYLFTNINKFIENTYYELWNTDIDNWDIYVEYLQENFYILNFGYFIREKAPKLNENTFLSISLSSLVFINFFMINKHYDKYIDKIEKSFLEPVIYGNKILFKKFINHLKIQLLHEYEYDEENQKLSKALQVNFIKKLPFKIRNILIEDLRIRKKFDFIQPMQLWDKTVDFNKLLLEIETALNNKIKVKFEDFEIYEEENELLIKNIKTLDVRDFSEDFYILSQDKVKRKEVIERNEEWIDCKKSRKKEIIKNIQSIVNPIKRFNEFEKYKRISPKYYYESLFNESKKTQKIDFNHIIPEDISLVSNYFRFELIDDYEKNKKISTNELLKDKELSRTLHKIFALPQELSPQVFSKVHNLSHKKQLELLKQYSDTVATPLNIFHLVKLINNTAKNKKFAKRIIRRILEKFSNNSLVEIKAYLAVYKYMYYRFKKEFEIEKNLLYVLSWGHTDRVFRNFLALGIDLEKLEEIFIQRTKFDGTEIFKFNNRKNVLHPLELDDVSFLFKGLNYALKDDLAIDVSDFNDFAFMENKTIPTYQLLKDFSLLDNGCNSFMDKDYKSFFNNILQNDKNYFSNNFLMEFSNTTISDLKKAPENVEFFNVLSAIVENKNIYKANRIDLLNLMNDINFKKIDDKYYKGVINFISKQNIYLKDKKLHEKIKAEIITKCKLCSTEKEISPYFDILVYLSISSSAKSEDRVLYFTDLLKEIETDINRNILKIALKNIVMSLPLNQSNIVSEYLVELRVR